MKLTQIAAKPKLIKVEINDEQTISEFGEALEFWIWDRQSMDTFVKMATIDYKDFGALTQIVRDLVLDEEGKPVVSDELVLPSHILMKAINVVVETLGKSVTTAMTAPTEISSS
jgi:hypothetical protein